MSDRRGGATRGGVLEVLLVLLMVLASCREEARGSMGAAGRAATGSGEQTRILGTFLDVHWRLPVPPQGDPPAEFSAAERSLDPALCGACHPREYHGWKTSLHAAAYSPGLAGQLVEGPLSDPLETRACQSCHAPLGEQQVYGPSGAPEPAFDSALRAQGIVCASCHVRGYRFLGPPRRPELPPLVARPPHGGFEERPEFLESRFCARCHQFFDDPGVNGKPIQNTYVEWQRSPQAAAGRHCQDCHMPDRAHLWRGIHDPQMVREAIDVELVPLEAPPGRLRAALVLRNRDVGHAFPTYVTPRVELSISQLDESGVEISGTRVQALIGREIDLARMLEVFDTRVLPGESVKLEYDLEQSSGAVALVARVTIDPDFHYRGVFDELLGRLSDTKAIEQIREMRRRISDSRYLLTELRQSL